MTQERNDDIRLAEADAEQADLRVTTDEASEEEEVAGLRSDIEETRAEMGGTLEELGDRLDPSNLMDQAKENVREATIGRVEETAKGMSDMVMETIKRNPIPAAMAGAGIALLWANRSNGKGNGNGHGGDRRYDAYYGEATRYGQWRQGSGDEGQDIGSKARDAAGQIGENVSGAVGQVGQVGQDIGDTVGQRVNEVGTQLDRFMRASPLAVGAIAAGAGALIGALIPETPQEREMLGDASRQVSSAVRDTVDQATQKAEQSMDEAETAMSSSGS